MRKGKKMKAISISKNGVSVKSAVKIDTATGSYYAMTHGENGRGRWQVRIPLAAREFPVIESAAYELKVDKDIKLIDLKKKDKRENDMFLAVHGQADGHYLIFLDLHPGYRGGASYSISGNIQLISTGYEAQGDAGRMGGADCPVFTATGPCRIEWHRRGRLYGSPADWVAEFDGNSWEINEMCDCALQDAALNY